MKTLTFSTRTALVALAASAMTLWAGSPTRRACGNTSSTGRTPSTTSTPVRRNPTPQSANPNQGIRNCYDFASYCGDRNGRMPVGGRGAGDLRGDPTVKTRTSYANPANARYRPGDWIVTSGGHAGYVNSQGGIDHFLQVPGSMWNLYTNPNKLPQRAPGAGPGGVQRNNTMDQFLGSGYIRQPGVSVEVLGR